MRFYRFLFLLGAVACSESPTLSGKNPAIDGSGALIVSRSEFLDGVATPLPRNTVIDPQSGATRSLATFLPTGYPGMQGLTFSRDGEWMAWIQSRGDPRAPCYQTPDYCWPTDRPSHDLFVSRVGSGQATLITPEYSYDGVPSFSPDGRRLVFLRSYYNSEQQMVTVARDGSDLQPVLQRTPRARSGPDWSPGGTSILYYQPDAGSLWRVTPDGKTHEALTANRSVYGDPTWSPDGSRIAVPVPDGGSEFGVSLAVLSVVGDEIARIPFSWQNRGRRSAWSPDGRFIAYCEGVYAGDGRLERNVVRLFDVSARTSRTVTPAGYSDCDPIWRP